MDQRAFALCIAGEIGSEGRLRLGREIVTVHHRWRFRSSPHESSATTTLVSRAPYNRRMKYIGCVRCRYRRLGDNVQNLASSAFPDLASFLSRGDRDETREKYFVVAKHLSSAQFFIAAFLPFSSELLKRWLREGRNRDVIRTIGARTV